MDCGKIQAVLLSRVGDTWATPYEADATGDWVLRFDSGDFIVALVAGDRIILPDEFINDAENTFKLIRPDGTLFNNTCYTTYISFAEITGEAFAERHGKTDLTIDGTTETGYTDDELKGIVSWQVFKNGLYQHSGVTFDDDRTFTWSFTTDDEVTIIWVKP